MKLPEISRPLRKFFCLSSFSRLTLHGSIGLCFRLCGQLLIRRGYTSLLRSRLSLYRPGDPKKPREICEPECESIHVGFSLVAKKRIRRLESPQNRSCLRYGRQLTERLLKIFFFKYITT